MEIHGRQGFGRWSFPLFYYAVAQTPIRALRIKHIDLVKLRILYIVFYKYFHSHASITALILNTNNERLVIIWNQSIMCHKLHSFRFCLRKEDFAGYTYCDMGSTGFGGIVEYSQGNDT